MSWKVEKGRKWLGEGGRGLKTVEDGRKRWINEFDPILQFRKVTCAGRKSKKFEKQKGSRR
jgi:hypothetical protein